MWPYIVSLSVVQGLTEFLPISSSGHLALLELLWGVELPGLLFEVLVHLGTLIAVVWVFRARVAALLRAPLARGARGKREGKEKEEGKEEENLRLLWLIAVGTAVTVALAFPLRGWIEQAFGSALAVGLALLATGGLLFSAERRARCSPGGRSLGELTVWDALLVGAMQGLATFPGISRSGFTIGMGLLLGLKREAAAEFSFILAIPAILGAALLKVGEASAQPGVYKGLIGPYLAGTALAMLTGVFAIRWLLRALQRGRLALFAYYCWGVGLLAVGGALAGWL